MNPNDTPEKIAEEQAGLPVADAPETAAGEDRAASPVPPAIPAAGAADQSPDSHPVAAANGAPTELKALFDLAQLQQQRLEDMQRSFDSKIKYDLNKEKVIDSLHRELQAYRDDLTFKILRPVLLDLITMYDDMDSLLKNADSQEPCGESELRLRRNLETFLHTIEEILYRNGVEVFSEEGAGFKAQRQRSIKIIETGAPEQDRLIAEHIRKGFSYEGKTLRPELVATFKYVAPRPAEDAERS